EPRVVGDQVRLLGAHLRVRPPPRPRRRDALRAEPARRGRSHPYVGRPRLDRRNLAMIPFLDLTRQHRALQKDLVEAMERVLGSSRFVLGPEGQALETELATLAGVRHGVGLGSGTDALRLALTAVGVGPGDEVITPAFSFVASASTVVMAGAQPVFADI